MSWFLRCRLQGFRQNADFEKARLALGKFWQALLVGPDLAIQSARNYHNLCQKGVTVRKTIDNMIAIFCIENDNELRHNNSDFDGYENILDWGSCSR